MAIIRFEQLECPKRKQWVSFRLVNESGDGQPYSGLRFKLYDALGTEYPGKLDEDGFARVDGIYAGPALLSISETYGGGEDWYETLIDRKAYPLPITALQVLAEQSPTGPVKADGSTWLAEQRAAEENARFFRVEVSDFVSANKHLPAPDTKWGPRPSAALKSAAGEMEGVALEPNQHHVFEIKALRAYSPLFSLAPEFSALNAYHLAVMSVLSYAPFGAKPGFVESYKPSPPPYDAAGSIGHVLREQLARLEKPTQFDTASYHLLCEEVPYSKRLEVVPYDPARYPQQQEGSTPESVHFLHDKDTETQAFVTHNDQTILVSIRGTVGFRDWLRDFDARQISADGMEGQVHRGFYGGFLAVQKFLEPYLEDFYTRGQTILISGHSLGGAIALLVAQWLKTLPAAPKVILYTYGAPRAGTTAFVESARDLVHHRLINHNDPIPSVPFTWMDAEWKLALPGTVSLLASIGAPYAGVALLLGGLLNLKGHDYGHHGEQRHFMPRKRGGGSEASVLWQPGEAIEHMAGAELAAKLDLERDEVKRGNLLLQMAGVGHHSSNTGYARAALANLLRWNASLSRNGALFTEEELQALQPQLRGLEEYLSNWEAGSFQAFEKQVRARHDTRFYNMSKTERVQAYHGGVERARDEQMEQLAGLSRAQERLLQQAQQPVTPRCVFGDRANHEALPRLLSEWRQLADVKQAEQLAVELARTEEAFA
ncbi:lipase family protein [Pseudomonas sp. OIL-1]|uniref:lipase family protein n=1 Tax=Pseudomonas sp. OIL-1 TaxID=2706126 RepID=UPI0015B388A8|nr:lipase family protein [Pseudomonas sp. OIL-1]